MQKDKDLRKFLLNILKRLMYADILMLRGSKMSTGWLDGCLRIVLTKVSGCYPSGGSCQCVLFA